MQQLGIVGLGYVGQPLASAFASAGHPVVGYDIDERTIERLRTTRPVTTGQSGASHEGDGLEYTSNADRLRDCDVVITAVPTPITESSTPDLSKVRSAGRTIGEQLAPGTTVVLESTVYPGTTREEFVPELEDRSGLSAGDDFDFGYSPERIDPGDEDSLRRSVKPVGANTTAVRSELTDLYGAVVETVYPAPTIESAEAAKCFENVQRDVNIALVNEFAMACNELDSLDYEDVLDVADTKWNFVRYTPGLVEGHCIPIDPYFLIDRLEDRGASASLMREARSVNESVVDFVVQLTVSAVAERAERLRGNGGVSDRILACGLSYKPNAEDLRSRAKERLFDSLRDRGFDPIGYDPNVDPDEAATTFDLEVWSSIDDGDAAGVLMLTGHDAFSSITIDRIADAFPDHPIVVDVPRVFERPTRPDVVYRRL